jgi:hypothetical protein
MVLYRETVGGFPRCDRGFCAYSLRAYSTTKSLLDCNLEHYLNYYSREFPRYD